MKEKQVKPFLKWAGGKTQLIDDIKENFIYQTTDEFSYVEPFVGSGAVLFWVLNNFPNLKYAVINDINEDLINSYKIIKSDVNNLVLALKQLEDEYYQFSEKPEEKKKYYYDKRELFNTRNCNKLTQASLFIFLNRTCFNGLYRVNKKNQFNVPIGSYKKPLICNEDNLKSVSSALQKVKFLTGDFEKTLDHVNDNSIFYLDPPYKPLSETSSFNSYANNEFNDNEQKRLKIFCDKLTSLGHNWILSNSDVKGKDPSNEFFDELYEEYKINRVVAKRSINANPNKRGLLTELLITNQGVLNGV
jgi:DNA adenine methylase